MAMNNCNSYCAMAVFLQFILLGIHLYVNMEQLHAWAMGNLWLLISTLWFVFISMWNLMLTIRLPEFYMLTSWKRVVPFVMASIGLFYWTAGVIFEIVKYASGDTWWDTVEEIFFAYWLWIQVPTAIIDLYYIAILIKRTDDIVSL